MRVALNWQITLSHRIFFVILLWQNRDFAAVNSQLAATILGPCYAKWWVPHIATIGSFLTTSKTLRNSAKSDAEANAESASKKGILHHLYSSRYILSI